MERGGGGETIALECEGGINEKGGEEERATSS